MNTSSILLLTHDAAMLRYSRALLGLHHYNVEVATSGAEIVRRIDRWPAPALILFDLAVLGTDSLDILDRCKEIRPEQRILVLGNPHDDGEMTCVMERSAIGWINTPCEDSQLQAAVQRMLDGGPAMNVAAPECTTNGNGPEIIDHLGDDLFFCASSEVMKQIHAQAVRIARVDVPVLLLGESGVGKEIVARLIHKMSIRSQRPMLKVNCAALPAELLESELFGYESGAFTGAHKSKPGKFELCHKGTILLDEIGEMSPALQAKLLHVLQDGQFCRLGGRADTTVDVRVLAATNINVQRALADRTLRPDLYFRLNAFTINIPPLRERREEIPLLLKHYINRLAPRFQKAPRPVSDRLLDACVNYYWPGNLREIANFVKRYLIFEDESFLIRELQAKSEELNYSDGNSRSRTVISGGLKALVRTVKDDAECKEIEKALHNANWNRKVAAANLNISYKALLYKIKQHGLCPPSMQEPA